jgi:hypothetical protein
MENVFIDDAEEASFSLNSMLAGYDENTSAYAHMPTRNPYSHFCYALNVELTAEEVIQALKKYLAELERGECREVLCIEKKMMRKEYWQKGGLLRRNLLSMRERLKCEKMIAAILKVQSDACYDDFIERLENSYAEVARLLGEIHRKMTRQTYGQFYKHLKSQHDAEPVMMAYDEWMMNEGDNTFKTLKGKQTWTVASFLIREKRPLRYMRVPTESEINEVQMALVLEYKPWGMEYPEDFRMQCARFRRFNSWENHILKLDYEILGKYLFQNYYKMTNEDRKALFDMDIMLELINRDIAKVMPVEEKEEKKDKEEQSVAKILTGLRPFAVKQEVAERVVTKITELINMESKPKNIIRPIRAAIDAGVLHRPSWDAFVEEYGPNKVSSKSSFNDYTNPETEPYTGTSYHTLVDVFKQLLA